MLSRFSLEQWEVNPLKNELQLNGKIHTLESRQMQLLCYFCSKPNQVISIDELVAQVWGNKIVGNHAVYRAINQLRKTLQQNTHLPELIKTLPKKGYILELAKEIKIDDFQLTNTSNLNCDKPPAMTARIIAELKNQTIAISILLTTIPVLIYVSMQTLGARDSKNISASHPIVVYQQKNVGKLKQQVLSFQDEREFPGTVAVEIDDSNAINLGTGSFTISAMINTQKEFGTIIEKRDMDDPIIGYLLMVYKDTLLFQMGGAETGWKNFYNSDAPIVTDGDWHRVEVKVERNKNNASVRLLIDKRVIFERNNFYHAGSLNNQQRLFIGKHHDPKMNFVGKIRDFSMTKLADKK